MNDKLTNFINWFHKFCVRSNKLYADMESTVENSQWHREANVAVHTTMVVNEYIAARNNATNEIWSHNDILGAFACAFHDVGKPLAGKINGPKFNKERGRYRIFKTHEAISASMWTDWAIKNFSMLQERFNFTANDVTKVRWMIEYHLAWNIKKQQKVNELIASMVNYDVVDQFLTMMMSDTYGRISDDAETKQKNAESWVRKTKELVKQYINERNHSFKREFEHTVYVMIGIPGSGKSTIVTREYSNCEYYSWDDLRLKMYQTNNAKLAFKKSVKDKTFSNKVMKIYYALIAKRKFDVVIDNTNISKKRRRVFIDHARKRGYKVVGVYVATNINTAINRQTTRPCDQSVPTEVIERMHAQLNTPQYGEFDDVVTFIT